MSKIRYKTIAILEDGTQLDISGAAEDMGWEEGEDELATRISFSCQNASYGGQRLSQLIKPGGQVAVSSDWGAGWEEVASGSVMDWEPSRRSSEDTFSVTAYDALYFFEKSQDSRYITAGTGTKSALMALFDEWGIPVGEYQGPDIAHEKTQYKNKTLGAITLDLLDTAKKQGGPRCLVRCQKGQIFVVPYGSNEAVYHFDEDRNLTVTKERISIKNLVTRMKIVGKETTGAENVPVEAIIDGHTEFGIRQRIYNHSSNVSLDEAKKEAQSIIDEQGEPENDITLEAPDLPMIRKGDMVHVSGVNHTGYFYVLSIRHNAANGTMKMEVEAVEG